MRFVVALALLLGSSVASARHMVRISTLRDLCPGGKSWDAVATCIARQGKFTVLRDTATAKLIRLPAPGPFTGVYFYMRDDRNGWQMIGQLRLAEFELLAFESLPGGYRFDVGVTGEQGITLDNETVTLGFMKRKLTMMCSTAGRVCTEIVTACDVFLHGKAYWSYRARLALSGGMLKVASDGGNASPICAAQPDVEMPFD